MINEIKKAIEDNKKMGDRIVEVNDLYTRLENYVTAFDWDITYYTSKQTNEDGTINDYYATTLAELIERKAIRSTIVKKVLEELAWYI